MGAPLARLEGQRCIGRLVERFSRIERAPGTPNWVDALAMRGVDRLPVILY
jgi:cytochrome P450